jgi:hypothetical protein
VEMPVLKAKPADYVVNGVTYRAVRLDDWNAVVRELKAACIALGQTEKECQAQ